MAHAERKLRFRAEPPAPLDMTGTERPGRDRPLSCLHVVAGLHPDSGGPARTVVALTDALAALPDIDVALVTQGAPEQPAMSGCGPAVSRYAGLSNSTMALRAGWPAMQQMSAAVAKRCPLILHSHGVWLPVNFWAGWRARRSGIRHVVQPRGMLEPWSLGHHAWKKRLAWSLYQRRELQMANLLVATAEQEFLNLRRLGLRQPVAVIPNGVALDSQPLAAGPSAVPAQPRTALFLSRIHPKKGLFVLMQAWARVRPEGWRLHIAGPDEGGHLNEVMGEARRCGIESAVAYLGVVDGEEKTRVLRGADLFILPTFSENFGMAVAEALAHGLPVITTRAAPWADIEVHRCGWWVDVGAEPLAAALRQAVALSQEARTEMGRRGQTYVRRFAWPGVAEQTVQAYRWLLGNEARPGFVHLD